MNLSVYKIDGSNSGKEVTLDEKVFGVTPNDHAIYLDVVQYLANQRQGTAKTKDRSENAHSTKKIGRQKGGGGARHGSLKSGIYVGGGTIHGPEPRCYWHKLNKKVKSLARVSALSYKASENAITLVEPFTMEAPKTISDIKGRAAHSHDGKTAERRTAQTLSRRSPFCRRRRRHDRQRDHDHQHAVPKRKRIKRNKKMVLVFRFT